MCTPLLPSFPQLLTRSHCSCVARAYSSSRCSSPLAHMACALTCYVVATRVLVCLRVRACASWRSACSSAAAAWHGVGLEARGPALRAESASNAAQQTVGGVPLLPCRRSRPHLYAADAFQRRKHLLSPFVYTLGRWWLTTRAARKGAASALGESSVSTTLAASMIQ